MKTPKKLHRPYHVNYLQGFWLDLLKDCYTKITLLGKDPFKKLPLLKGRFSFKLRWEHVVIAFLLALLLGGARARIIPEYASYTPPKLLKPIAQTHLEPTQTTLDPIPVAAPPPPPTPVYTAPVSAAANCGSDSMMAYIYTVESGCRTWAINPGGCIGLGQACPGGKLPCGLYDWACQDAWFRSYAVSAYGSIYNAYIFRTQHNWW